MRVYGYNHNMENNMKRLITWKVFACHEVIMESKLHYIDVIMTTMASQITSLTVVYSTVYSDADQRKHQSSASLAFVRGIHRGPVNSPHKRPVTRNMFPFDDVIMCAVQKTGELMKIIVYMYIVALGSY